MKKCNNCQTECKDDAIFCPECGERLEPEMGQEKTVDTQETVSEESQKDMAEMNLAWKEKLDSITGMFKKNWKLVLGAICILVVIVAASVAIKNKKYTINLEDFYEVEFSGGNKYAHASLEYKYDALREYIFEVSDKEDDLSSFFDYTVADWVDDNVEATLNKSENLKNGDVVKVTLKYPKKNKVNGYKIKGKSFKVRVKGLENYKEIGTKELFRNVHINLEGYSPKIEVSIETDPNDDVLKYVSFDVEQPYDKKNGDTVEIHVTDNGLASGKYVYVGDPIYKFKIKEQPEYITSADMITEKELNAIKKQVDNAVKEKWEQKEGTSFVPIGLKKLAVHFRNDFLYYSSFEGYYEIQYVDEDDNTTKTMVAEIRFTDCVKNEEGVEELSIEVILPEWFLSSDGIKERYEDFISPDSGAIELL